MTLDRIASFSTGAEGGNPAGVWIGEQLPAESEMQRIAAELGYSETAFAAPSGAGWRVRYFAPQKEVPFCGHATIALGAVLAATRGDGVFPLALNDAEITVEGRAREGRLEAALLSPPTRSRPVEADVLAETLALFGWTSADLDPTLPPARIHGGADHLVIAVKTRETLAAMAYDFEAGRRLMLREGWITILLVFAETATRFHARNAFAAGGIVEDPATGAAAAAFAGYLRDLGRPASGAIEVIQGVDMGVPCLLHAEFGPEPGSAIRVAGTARRL